MHTHRILVLGDSLVADGITRMLGEVQPLSVVTAASTVETALATLAGQPIDALVVVGTTDTTMAQCLAVLEHYPNLPIIRSDIGVAKVQVLMSRCIDARLDLLLAAIAALPGQESAAPDQVPAIRGWAEE